MKRLSLYLLLFVMMFYSGGYFALFKLRQWNIHIEMDRTKHFPETLIIPYSYYINHLERDGKEIIWKGKYYDIKARHIKGKYVILKAKYDKKESSLISQLSHFLKEKDHEGTNAGNTFAKVLKMDFYILHSQLLIESPNTECKFYGFSESTLKGYHRLVYSPPRA